jgi:hypothetical protein
MADKLPEWARDLVNNVGDKAVRDIVNDLRSYNPSPSMGAASKVTPVGAGRVIDGDDVKAGTTGQHGWVTPPQVDNWKPPGEAAMNQILDAEDAKWRAERIKEMAETAKALQALAAAEAELKRKDQDK